MALVKCTNCGHMVSDRAKSCPKCGCLMEKEIEIKEHRHEDHPIEDLTFSDEYDTGIFGGYFSFNGRIGRLEFALSLILYYALTMWAAYYMKFSFYILIPINLICLLLYIAPACKRCHDLGHSGWFQLIPFYWLLLLFRKGDEYPNKYGNCPENNNTRIGISVLLIVVAAGIMAYFAMSGKSNEADTVRANENAEVEAVEDNTSYEENTSNTTDILADGTYCYKGDWSSRKYAAQPCQVEFVKSGDALSNCIYTNLKYDARIPLDGTIKGNKLYFVGNINGKQLVIDLEVSADGSMLNGKGVDYAHSGDEAKLNLEKSDASSIYSGLSFRTFTEHIYDSDNNEHYQDRLKEKQVVENLKEHGFTLTNSKKETRSDYTGEEYYDVKIDTYSKTIDGQTTTVKLEEHYTEIHFPSQSDVDKFVATVKAADMTQNGNEFKDNEDVYWTGTDVYVNGTTVKLDYKWDP